MTGQAQDQNDALNRGQAQEDQLDGPMKGQLQEQGGVLKGSASAQDTDLQAQDPDTADQELMVEWDKWHNRLLWSIQSGVQELINSPETLNHAGMPGEAGWWWGPTSLWAPKPRFL
ncbi:MAG: hypothetical protein HC888_13430 [Candidatus Competibacteraceae bacterium]|nr:hypothetical protein [Candidatus Competibacteraceae bacterium]